MNLKQSLTMGNTNDIGNLIIQLNFIGTLYGLKVITLRQFNHLVSS